MDHVIRNFSLTILPGAYVLNLSDGDVWNFDAKKIGCIVGISRFFLWCQLWAYLDKRAWLSMTCGMSATSFKDVEELSCSDRSHGPPDLAFFGNKGKRKGRFYFNEFLIRDEFELDYMKTRGHLHSDSVSFHVGKPWCIGNMRYGNIQTEMILHFLDNVKCRCHFLKLKFVNFPSAEEVKLSIYSLKTHCLTLTVASRLVHKSEKTAQPSFCSLSFTCLRVACDILLNLRILRNYHGEKILIFCFVQISVKMSHDVSSKSQEHPIT